MTGRPSGDLFGTVLRAVHALVYAHKRSEQRRDEISQAICERTHETEEIALVRRQRKAAVRPARRREEFPQDRALAETGGGADDEYRKIDGALQALEDACPSCQEQCLRAILRGNGLPARRR